MDNKQQDVIKFLSRAEELKRTPMTMEDIFNLSTKNNHKETAFIYTNQKGKIKHYKYSKFRKHAFEFASKLSQLLIDQPKNVPLVFKLANSPRWCEIFYAILMAGYKPLLVAANTSKDGVDNLIKQSHAIAVISDDPYNYSVTKFSTTDLLNKTTHNSFVLTWENEVIFCSSGTTGDVKLMVFNGRNLCSQITASLDMGNDTNDIMYPNKYGKIRILGMIPFHHIFGFVAVFLWYTFYGKTIVFPSSINTKEIQDICVKAKVSHVYSVPLFWDSLALQFERKLALETPNKQSLVQKFIDYNIGKIDRNEAGKAASNIARTIIQKNILGSAIRYCISGGGYLNNKTSSLINGIGYPLYNGYGMTELGVTSVELSKDVNIRLKGSIGKPLHGVSYKIKGDNDGELFVKSDITHVKEIVAGVIKDTKLDEEGYYPTGDIAHIDDTGRYYIKGRIKDIIINANGENIFPDELEIFFNKIENINKLCVLGVKKEHSSDENIVLAIEVSNSITKEQLDKIRSDVEETSKKLPNGAKIDEIYLCRNKLPVANNMKVKRYLVKKGIESSSKDYIAFSKQNDKKNNVNFSQEIIDKYVVPLRAIFSEVLILPEFKIDDDSHWINDLGGDSMNYVELITKVEDKFKIKFDEELYGQMACINDFAIELAKLNHDK